MSRFRKGDLVRTTLHGRQWFSVLYDANDHVVLTPDPGRTMRTDELVSAEKVIGRFEDLPDDLKEAILDVWAI